MMKLKKLESWTLDVVEYMEEQYPQRRFDDEERKVSIKMILDKENNIKNKLEKNILHKQLK